MRAARLLTLALAVMAFALLLASFAGRVAHPYDLEWMEGGMLAHALRLVEGKPLYAPPSLEFVPFLYTPLYPALLAALAKLFGLGYLLARSVSVLAYLGASFLGAWMVRREGGSALVALCAVAVPAAAFVPAGAWYDLARPDSLGLALTTLGVVLGGVAATRGSRAHLFSVLAAAAMVAAFLTKQTASPFMVAVGAALLVRGWRLALSYLIGLAVLGLPVLLLLDRSSSGWFWTYVFELHQQHAFRPVRGFLAAPGLLIVLLFPGLLLIGWALRRARSPGLLYTCWIAAASFLVSCLGYGTMWAFVNAIIPGVFFTSLATGVAAGRLLAGTPSPRRARAVLLLLALGLLVAPNGPARLILPLTPSSWKMAPRALTGYDPRAFWPQQRDREAGERLLALLRESPGEVLVPPAPFYARLAGKRVFLHSMGVLDLEEARLPPPRGLADALRGRRFSLVVLDEGADLGLWPGLVQSYCLAERLDGPRLISGTPMQLTRVLRPDPRGLRPRRYPRGGSPTLRRCP